MLKQLGNFFFAITVLSGVVMAKGSGDEITTNIFLGSMGASMLCMMVSKED